jgi:hypothetical protein
MLSRPEIDHALHRAETNGPDADQVWRDDSGQVWHRFSVAYTIGDRSFTTSLWAHDLDDAERRLMALRATAKIAGQVYSERALG